MFQTQSAVWRLLIVLLALASQSVEADHVEYQPDQWWAIIRAQAEYVRSISQGRLDSSQASLLDAQARVTDERTVALREYNHQLKVDLRKLRIEERKNGELMKRFLEKLATISRIKSGRTSNSTVPAFNYFLDNLGSFKEVADAYKMEVPEAAKSADNFTHNTHGTKVEIKPFKGKNVRQLLKFMTTNNYSARGPFEEVIEVLMEAGTLLLTGVEEKRIALLAEVKALRESTFDIWHAPWISVLPNEFSGIRGYFPGGAPNSNLFP